ncbi:tRNA (adenosine(37)-N6)-threonylcarbamoyltransferase complex dimerization subunit type 1 TsaB [Phycicoccus sp. CSK15P-2]|uniref:tRNA (adenosine(37)-N6)-threonylcarbamoyltransferase complex dimerization subunit type 1 TsaB n=1 Tax=Phycicoccus sp. CSK15P-2 TaxID=2807627 RepID=UPI001EF28762|nr:tRNA (adenosine(37)-N6)-threonylcarbamoyltransferase complex dimerization subunit type 1 TsaB [Phycicoccus sp. CSK15P-2]
MLAVDTATSTVGAAVLRDGAPPVAAAAEGPRAQTELLAPLVERVLAEAGVRPPELTDLAVGTGPGPFTGLRVGLVTAVTMGHALGCPVHGVCSLDVLAEQALAASGVDEVLVATDARRREVYWARYRRGPDGAERLGAPAVDRPAELAEEVRALPTAGRGPLLYPESFPSRVDGVLDVDPGVLGALALHRLASGTPMPVEPLYLRRPDALTTAERAAR